MGTVERARAIQESKSQAEAERATLAAVLRDPSRLVEVRATGVCSQDFTCVRDQNLWTAICQEPPGDAATLQYALRKLPEDKFGGIAYLLELDNEAAPLELCLDDLAKARDCRAIVEATRHAAQLANEPGANPARIAADLGNELVAMAEKTGNGKAKAITEQLEARLFKQASEPPPLRTIYSLKECTISTPGNLTAISAAIKAGKSAVIGAMLASVMTKGRDGDMLGFTSRNPKGHALLHFDSEQSPEDHWHAVDRSLKRAGLASPPPWFYSYCLTGFGCEKAWECVQQAARTATATHGGMHSILIDGVADLVHNVNDPSECNDFVASLHDMAIKSDCPIIGIIHTNPGSDKTRGHLGSQLERKAETNLRLEKKDEVTTMWSDKQRRAPIPKHLGPQFEYSTAEGMHISCVTRKNAAEDKKREALSILADEVFIGYPSMKYSDIKITLMRVAKIADKTAEGKVSQMIKLKVIKKLGAGHWIRGTSDELPSTLNVPSELPS